MSITFPVASMTLTPVVEDPNSFAYQCEKTRQRYDFMRESGPVAKLVAEFTYKPGWFFGVKRRVLPFSGFTTYQFGATCVVVDSYHPGRFVPITGGYVYNKTFLDSMAKKEVVSAVLFTISQIEDHERREWLRHAGVLVDNPHLPGAYVRPAAGIFTGSWQALVRRARHCVL